MSQCGMGLHVPYFPRGRVRAVLLDRDGRVTAMDDIPAPIARLQEFIEHTLTGVLVDQRYPPESFGDMLFDYQIGINRVRVLRDRGQWDYACSYGTDMWYYLVDIRQALGHGDDLHELALDEQVDYAIDYLPMILAHGTRDNRLVEAIQAIKDERAFKMWGRPSRRNDPLA